MKKILFAAALACLALFTSCEKEGVENTGDTSGNLYGVWVLDTVAESAGAGKEVTETDYSGVHFYLALGEFPRRERTAGRQRTRRSASRSPPP